MECLFPWAALAPSALAPRSKVSLYAPVQHEFDRRPLCLASASGSGTAFALAPARSQLSTSPSAQLGREGERRRGRPASAAPCGTASGLALACSRLSASSSALAGAQPRLLRPASAAPAPTGAGSAIAGTPCGDDPSYPAEDRPSVKERLSRNDISGGLATQPGVCWVRDSEVPTPAENSRAYQQKVRNLKLIGQDHADHGQRSLVVGASAPGFPGARHTTRVKTATPQAAQAASTGLGRRRPASAPGGPGITTAPASCGEVAAGAAEAALSNYADCQRMHLGGCTRGGSPLRSRRLASCSRSLLAPSSRSRLASTVPAAAVAESRSQGPRREIATRSRRRLLARSAAWTAAQAARTH